MNNFAEIVSDVRRGNELAIKMLYNNYVRFAYNASLRLLDDTREAEEVAHDTFIKVLSVLNDFSGNEGAFISYIKTTAINRSIDILRKKKAMSFVKIDDMEDIAIENNGFEEDDYEDADLDMIFDAIQHLPTGYRIILTLHLIENMDFADIAGQLDIKPSSVRSQFARAKNKLITLVKQYKNGH